MLLLVLVCRPAKRIAVLCLLLSLPFPLLQVLFPLSKETSTSDFTPDDHLNAANLVSRVFLHNVQTLAAMDNFNLLWLKLVGSMAKDMRGECGSNRKRAERWW